MLCVFGVALNHFSCFGSIINSCLIDGLIMYIFGSDTEDDEIQEEAGATTVEPTPGPTPAPTIGVDHAFVVR